MNETLTPETKAAKMLSVEEILWRTIQRAIDTHNGHADSNITLVHVFRDARDGIARIAGLEQDPDDF
jgi:hypothetical protein